MTTSVNNNIMEIDMNINEILHELIKFLECLRDVKLPLKLESLRDELLVRAKNTLSVTRASSPDRPYLDMNSGPKSLLLTKNETDLEDYVGMDGSQKQSHQDYYETCENKISSPSTTLSKNTNLERHTDDLGQKGEKLLEIYKNFSAAQSKSNCHKCGSLCKKEEKKLFQSDSRACWIALVGSHLLIYRSERQSRPYAIYPIRGYMARAAPHLMPRDREKKESAFEIYKPGNETLQFIARTRKDMEQWIAKVYEVGCCKESMNSDVEIREKRGATNEPSPSVNRRGNKSMLHQDAAAEKPIAANKSNESSQRMDHYRDERKRQGKMENPPPLPSRIPRRLPSLPPDSAIPSYRVAVEDDDDDDEIYHKIEDLMNGTCYQNLALRRRRAIIEQQDIVSYDDIHGPSEKGEQLQVANFDDTVPQEETYDDIVALSRTITGTEHQNHQDGNAPDAGEEKEEFYDDVQNLILNEKITKDRTKDQADASDKSTQKKSFFGRVLNRKESFAKSSEKKCKGKISSPPNLPASPVAIEEMPTYDDVSDLIANRESLTNDEELPEYNCPPPPRPVYETKPSVANNLDNEVEEIYDDVNTCREQYNKTHQQILPELIQELKAKDAKSDAATCKSMSLRMNDDLSSQEESEHYQSPRSDLRICEIQQTAEIQQQVEEELYDDVALLTDFKARQRIVAEQKDNEDNRSTSSPDKKSWNRFGVNRRSRTSDTSPSATEQTNRRSSNDCEETEDALDKKTTFKKLISKMENSLARVSTRSSTSPLAAKSSATNNNF